MKISKLMLIQIGDLYPLIGTAAFSFSSAIIRKMDAYGTAIQLNFLRASMGAIIFVLHLLVVGLFFELLQISPYIFLMLVLSVLFNVVIGDSAYFEAQNRIGLKIAMPLVNTYPLITILFAAVWLKEEATIDLILGGLIIILGVILLSLDTTSEARSMSQLGDQKSPRYLLLGLILTLVAMLCYVLGIIFTTIGTKGLNPIVANSVRLPVASVLLLSLIIMQNPSNRKMKQSKSSTSIAVKSSLKEFGQKNYHAPSKIKLLLFTAGFLGTYVSSIFLVLSVQTIGASRTAVLFSTGPLFSLPLAIFWLKETASWKALIGTVLTVAGLWIILT